MKFAAVRHSDESIRALNFANFSVQNYLYFRGRALGFQHGHNILRAPVAKKLAQGLFVISGNAVLFDQRDTKLEG